MRLKKKRMIYLRSSSRMPFFQMVQVRRSLESIFLKLGINSMKFTLIAFVLFAAAVSGEYFGRLAVAYYDSHIENKVQERIEEYKTKGKPAYCSFYQ